MTNNPAPSRTKRAIYVVLFWVAFAMSTFAAWNQVMSDNNAHVLADQVTQACTDNRALAESQGLNCAQAQDIKQDPAPLQGVKGDKGEQGDMGPTGLPGVPGAQGLKGDTGAVGANGVDGAPATGVQGAQGTSGPMGPKGDKGDTGAQGDRGADGQPAPQIESMKFEGDLSACTFVVHMTDGQVFNIPVGGQLCI